MIFTFLDVNPQIFKVRRRRDLNGAVSIHDVNTRYLSYDEVGELEGFFQNLYIFVSANEILELPCSTISE